MSGKLYELEDNNPEDCKQSFTSSISSRVMGNELDAGKQKKKKYMYNYDDEA